MENCNFCDFSKIADNTLVSIRGINITATLGQITDGGYLLIIPVKHIPCIGAFNRDQIDVLKKVLDEVGFVLREEYSAGLTMFEHGIVGQTVPHAHLHLLPATFDMTKRITRDFSGSKVEILSGLRQLRLLYQLRQAPYMLWTDPAGYMRVCWNPPAPKMYLRLIAAKMLGVPERGDWKGVDPDLDQKLRRDTMVRLTPYFLTRPA